MNRPLEPGDLFTVEIGEIFTSITLFDGNSLMGRSQLLTNRHHTPGIVTASCPQHDLENGFQQACYVLCIDGCGWMSFMSSGIFQANSYVQDMIPRLVEEAQ
jgi:hypothetical protein